MRQEGKQQAFACEVSPVPKLKKMLMSEGQT